MLGENEESESRFKKKSKAALIKPLKDFLFFFFFFFAELKLQLVNVIFIPSIPFCYHGWNYLKNVLRDENYRLFLCLFWGEAPGETQTHFCELVENFGENGKANFLARWLLHRQNFPRARTSDKPCKGTLSKTYVCMYVCINNHRSSGFRSNHWSFIATVLFRMVRKL